MQIIRQQRNWSGKLSLFERWFMDTETNEIKHSCYRMPKTKSLFVNKGNAKNKSVTRLVARNRILMCCCTKGIMVTFGPQAALI